MQSSVFAHWPPVLRNGDTDCCVFFFKFLSCKSDWIFSSFSWSKFFQVFMYRFVFGFGFEFSCLIKFLPAISFEQSFLRYLFFRDYWTVFFSVFFGQISLWQRRVKSFGMHNLKSAESALFSCHIMKGKAERALLKFLPWF